VATVNASYGDKGWRAGHILTEKKHGAKMQTTTTAETKRLEEKTSFEAKNYLLTQEIEQ